MFTIAVLNVILYPIEIYRQKTYGSPRLRPTVSHRWFSGVSDGLADPRWAVGAATAPAGARPGTQAALDAAAPAPLRAGGQDRAAPAPGGRDAPRGVRHPHGHRTRA